MAGYAWDWVSKNDKTAFDIELDGERMRWNSSQRDWTNSKHSIEEVGSIHTVQGYALNYAGDLIGADLRYSSEQQRIVFDRKNYYDKRGLENNRKCGLVYSDEDFLNL